MRNKHVESIGFHKRKLIVPGYPNVKWVGETSLVEHEESCAMPRCMRGTVGGEWERVV